MQFIRSHKLAATLVLAAFGIWLVFSPIKFPFLPTDYDDALARVIFIAILIAGIALIGGTDGLRPEKGTLGASVRFALYPIIAMAILAAFGLAGRYLGGTLTVPDDVVVQIVGVVLLAATIGVFEELLFRYVLFGGLLSRFGGTKAGLMGSLVVSCFIFGFAHVMFDFEPDALIVAQMALKTIETMLMGFVFAACFLVGKNIWGAAIVHAVTDCMLMLVMVFQTSAELGTYVTTGSDGMTAVVAYVFEMVVLIPCYVKSWKAIKSLPLPQQGPFGSDR